MPSDSSSSEADDTGEETAEITGERPRAPDVEDACTLRWTLDEDGEPENAVVQQRTGAFDDFEPRPMGGDGTETHNLTGRESRPENAGSE